MVAGALSPNARQANPLSCRRNSPSKPPRVFCPNSHPKQAKPVTTMLNLLLIIMSHSIFPQIIIKSLCFSAESSGRFCYSLLTFSDCDRTGGYRRLVRCVWFLIVIGFPLNEKSSEVMPNVDSRLINLKSILSPWIGASAVITSVMTRRGLATSRRTSRGFVVSAWCTSIPHRWW